MSNKDYYRKRLIDLRTRKKLEREAKKRDNENYARMIKAASSPSGKASLRKSKIDRAASHDRVIASIQRDIDSTTAAMHRC